MQINAVKGVYNSADVLYIDNNSDGVVQATEILAYTSASAGALDLRAAYVGNITVKIADTSTITDGSTNKIDNSVTVTATK
ncbi:hypothetical protein D3C79_949790 [compost metagenome]